MPTIIYLEGFLSRVDQLVSLQLGAFNEGLATLGAHMHPGTVSMKVLTHGSIVTKHLTATLVEKIRINIFIVYRGKNKRGNLKPLKIFPKILESSLCEDREYSARFHLPLDDAAFLYAYKQRRKNIRHDIVTHD
jgi:hypothetical protein